VEVGEVESRDSLTEPCHGGKSLENFIPQEPRHLFKLR
jgi:hypothetical protein